MVRARLEVVGADGTARRLEEVAANLEKPLAPLLEVLGQDWASTFQEGISLGRLDLPDLHPVTKAIRRHYGHTGQKLVRGGDLLQSIRPLAFGEDFVEVGTNLSYAHTVQFGGEVTDARGRRRRVQSFPFIVLSDELVEDTVALIAEYFLGDA